MQMQTAGKRIYNIFQSLNESSFFAQQLPLLFITPNGDNYLYVSANCLLNIGKIV